MKETKEKVAFNKDDDIGNVQIHSEPVPPPSEQQRARQNLMNDPETLIAMLRRGQLNDPIGELEQMRFRMEMMDYDGFPWGGPRRDPPPQPEPARIDLARFTTQIQDIDLLDRNRAPTQANFIADLTQQMEESGLV
jgi:hypothetical protein